MWSVDGNLETFAGGELCYTHTVVTVSVSEEYAVDSALASELRLLGLWYKTNGFKLKLQVWCGVYKDMLTAV